MLLAWSTIPYCQLVLCNSRMSLSPLSTRHPRHSAPVTVSIASPRIAAWMEADSGIVRASLDLPILSYRRHAGERCANAAFSLSTLAFWALFFRELLSACGLEVFGGLAARLPHIFIGNLRWPKAEMSKIVHHLWPCTAQNLMAPASKSWGLLGNEMGAMRTR